MKSETRDFNGTFGYIAGKGDQVRSFQGQLRAQF